MRWARPSTTGGLADAGLADEHRVVLGPAAEHLDDPADLAVPPDDRVDLPSRARAVRSTLYFSSAWKVPSGSGLVTRAEPRTD